MSASRKHLFTGNHHACWDFIDAHTLPRLCHLRPLNRSVSAQYPCRGVHGTTDCLCRHDDFGRRAPSYRMRRHVNRHATSSGV
jgi:hypothetical protein